MTYCDEHKALRKDVKDIKNGVEKIRDNHLRHLNYKLNISRPVGGERGICDDCYSDRDYRPGDEPMIEIEVPDKLQIGGFWYNVAYSPQEDAYLKERGWWGRYSEAELLCSVRSDAAPQLMSATLIEELFHAIEVVYTGKQLDHGDLKALAQGWFQVLEQLGVRLGKKV